MRDRERLLRQFYSSRSNSEIDKQKKKFEALNEFVQSKGRLARQRAGRDRGDDRVSAGLKLCRTISARSAMTSSRRATVSESCRTRSFSGLSSAPMVNLSP
jgi:hypothetical protein